MSPTWPKRPQTEAERCGGITQTLGVEGGVRAGGVLEGVWVWGGGGGGRGDLNIWKIA